MKMANTPKNSMMADGNDLLNFRPHFAKRFKMLRTSNQLTGKIIGQMLNLKSASIITYWEKGINIPSLDVLHRIILLFGVTTDYLLGYIDEPYNETLISKIEASLSDTISKLGIDYDVKNYSLEERANIIFLLQAVNHNTEKFLPLLLTAIKKG